MGNLEIKANRFISLLCVFIILSSYNCISFAKEEEEIDDYLQETEEMTLEELYLQMKKTYLEGNKYRECMECCLKIGNYKDTEKYVDLLKGRIIIGYFDTNNQIINHVKKLAQDISFADTKEVIVSNTWIADAYLQGYWTTKDGMHTFEMKDDGGYISTVPVVPQAGDAFFIKNGILSTYYKDFRNTTITEQFEIIPITESEMEIHSFQTDQIYRLSKRR